MMKKAILMFLCSACVFPAYSELLSFSSASDLLDTSRHSVDAGISLGDVDVLGVRYGYQLQETLQLFGSVNHVDPGSFDDWSMGVGLLFTLPEFDVPFRSGVKISLHYLSTTERRPHGRIDMDISEFTVRYVANGNIEQVDRMRWFGEIGLHFFNTSTSFSSDFDPEGPRRARGAYDDTELGLEAGVLYDVREEFSLFSSVEIVDNVHLNIGARYRF